MKLFWYFHLEKLPNVKSVHGILVLKHKHRTLKQLRRLKAQPTLHGDQVWRSSFIVMDYLEKYPLPEGQHVLDIGCGWGLLGIYCAKNHGSQVHMIDADQNVLPYIRAHTTLNDVNPVIEVARFEDLSEQHFEGKDVLFGCDICFWPELATQLQKVIDKALASNVKKIIIADPGRDTFRKLAYYCKNHYGARVIPGKITRGIRSGYMLVIEKVLKQAS